MQVVLCLTVTHRRKGVLTNTECERVCPITKKEGKVEMLQLVSETGWQNDQIIEKDSLVGVAITSKVVKTAYKET